MHPLLQQVIDTWHVNNRINLMLIDELEINAFTSTLSQKGGRTVAGQLSHMHNTRLQWLEACAPDYFKGQTKIPKETNPDKTSLKASFSVSADGIANWINGTADGEGKIKGYKKGAVHFLGYILAHEAHHRGNILLTIKQSGFKISDQLKWGIWEWGKI